MELTGIALVQNKTVKRRSEASFSKKIMKNFFLSIPTPLFGENGTASQVN